jgi:RND family efflux transporter MFP subunit
MLLRRDRREGPRREAGRVARALSWLGPPILLIAGGVALSPALTDLQRAYLGPQPAASQELDWPREPRGIDPGPGGPTPLGEEQPEYITDEPGASAFDLGGPQFASGHLEPGEEFQLDDADSLPSYDCLIEPWETVEVGSPVTGRIESLSVERGDTVEVGQVVVQLDSRVEKATVELARARAGLDAAIRASEAALNLDERREKRASNLYKQDALSLDIREEIETEARLARLRLQEAQENQQLASLEFKQAMQVLQRRTIRSPISGVVVDRVMSLGEVVDEEDEILKIAQVNPLRVEVILPSAAFGSVQKGMNAAVIPDLPGDEVYVASVKIVDAMIHAASGTFGVLLELPNPDNEIPGGLHCQARFLSPVR